MTCMSLQPTAAVFRLMRNHCKLETKEYADNLITHLDSARTCRTITPDDLSNVLHGLSGKAKNGTNTEVPSSTELPFAVGDYVAAFWFDGQYKWYLGVVDNVREDIVTVSCMARSDSRGRDWVFPEHAELLETPVEQILASKIKVEYTCSVRIRCHVSSPELIAELNQRVGELKKT